MRWVFQILLSRVDRLESLLPLFVVIRRLLLDLEICAEQPCKFQTILVNLRIKVERAAHLSQIKQGAKEHEHKEEDDTAPPTCLV